MIKNLSIILLITLALSFTVKDNFKGIKRRGPPPYDQSRSRYLVDLAAVTFCREQIITNWDCYLCKKHPNIVNVTHIKDELTSIVGFVAYDTNTSEIVVSWRFTLDVRNWYEDFNFEYVDYPDCFDCKIHAGFFDSYRSVKKKVNAAVQALFKLHPNSYIVTTGLSLGGALSSICALELYREYGERVREVHNFGSPRLGNGQLARYQHEKIPIVFRVVHHRDIVPHLPPTEFKYVHPAYEVLYDEKMNSYKVCNESGEDKTCSDRFSPDFSFQDHGHYFVKVGDKIC